jgi:hypothetical protein
MKLVSRPVAMADDSQDYSHAQDATNPNLHRQRMLHLRELLFLAVHKTF